MSTPLSTCRCACLALPASAATGTPAACAWSMTSFGGEPSALAISLIGCLSATSTWLRATECSQPRTPSERSSSSGSGGTPRSASVLATKSRWRLRDQLVDVDRGALGRHLGGHHDVDAVRLAVGVLVHPPQHGFEVVGVVEPHAAKHAETARLADRGGHLLRRGEDEDRVLDAEPVTQFGAHVHVPAPTCLACTSSAGPFLGRVLGPAVVGLARR